MTLTARAVCGCLRLLRAGGLLAIDNTLCSGAEPSLLQDNDFVALQALKIKFAWRLKRRHLAIAD